MADTYNPEPLCPLCGQLEETYTPQEVSSTLRAPIRTLDRWRRTHTGPPFIRIGARVRYPASGLQSWLKAHTVTPG